LVPYLLGDVQKSEKEEECSDIEKMEGSGDSKGQIPIEGGVAIETIKRIATDLRMAQEKGQNWISMR
jgi:3-keto-L-gulonate-6-phosphate decarboxylase